MVNTFLTDSDFRKSASNLDRQRLGKQRVEAFQILNILNYLNILSEVFSNPYTKEKNLKQWISSIVKHYKSLDVIYLIKENIVYYLPKQPQQQIIPGYQIIKLGFANHPAVIMWYGYQDALKLYINCHIDEWIKRGYQNNMIRYDVIGNPDRPIWTYDAKIHKNHMSALLTKELQRNEPFWYQMKTEFRNAGKFQCYIWPN